MPAKGEFSPRLRPHLGEVICTPGELSVSPHLGEVLRTPGELRPHLGEVSRAMPARCLQPTELSVRPHIGEVICIDKVPCRGSKHRHSPVSSDHT